MGPHMVMADNILKFPAKVSVKAATAHVLKAYGERAETVELAFRISNLTSKQPKKSLASASQDSVVALLELLRKDIDAHIGLVELLVAVRGRVQSALMKR
jgi:hypothetical protein